jgi:hypothetical protein
MEQSVLRFDMDLRCFPRGEGLELGGRVQGRAVSAKCQVLQSDAEVSGQMLLTSNARVNIKILIGEHCRYRFLICSSPFLVPCHLLRVGKLELQISHSAPLRALRSGKGAPITRFELSRADKTRVYELCRIFDD